uniref:Uncharacterized protein n=1 Tax=Oryza punctata TaxID=4537 RepID=A0A0E0LAA9_ORYPU
MSLDKPKLVPKGKKGKAKMPVQGLITTMRPTSTKHWPERTKLGLGWGEEALLSQVKRRVKKTWSLRLGDPRNGDATRQKAAAQSPMMHSYAANSRDAGSCTTRICIKPRLIYYHAAANHLLLEDAVCRVEKKGIEDVLFERERWRAEPGKQSIKAITRYEHSMLTPPINHTSTRIRIPIRGMAARCPRASATAVDSKREEDKSCNGDAIGLSWSTKLRLQNNNCRSWLQNRSAVALYDGKGMY